MLAARYDTSGSEHALIRIVEMERPEPGEGEVLVRVAVSGVNPTDWKSRLGGGQAGTASGFGWVIPNQDGAGIIEETGPGVDHDRVGEPVWLWECQWQRAMGSAAQYIVLPERQAVPLPDHATLDMGAGLGIPAMTAHRCLFSGASIDGASILVHGGAGAVGHAAIQLAARAGARVAATVSSPEKAKIAQEAGAGLVVNYREDDVVDVLRGWAPHGIDRIVEVAISKNLETDGAVLAPYGTIASYGAPDGPLPPSRELITKNARLDFVLVYTMPEEAKHDAVVEITHALEEDDLQPLPTTRFPLEEAQAAHEAVQGGFVGKVLIDVPQEPDPGVTADVEIERKFLVTDLPPDLEWLDARALRQGYVALDGDTEVRVRDDAGDWRLTVKHGGGLLRVEEDMEIDPRRGEALWALTDGRRVEKRRHRMPYGSAMIEVDVFEGALDGLVVAEVEFPDEETAVAFAPPDWFGREVTEDGAYKNRALAVDGRPA